MRKGLLFVLAILAVGLVLAPWAGAAPKVIKIGIPYLSEFVKTREGSE